MAQDILEYLSDLSRWEAENKLPSLANPLGSSLAASQGKLFPRIPPGYAEDLDLESKQPPERPPTRRVMSVQAGGNLPL